MSNIYKKSNIHSRLVLLNFLALAHTVISLDAGAVIAYLIASRLCLSLNIGSFRILR